MWLAGWLADMQYSEPGITLSPLVGTQTAPPTETLARFLQRQRQPVERLGSCPKALPSRDLPGGAADGSPPASARVWVQSLVQEDSTRLGATKPVRHNPRPPQPEEAPEPQRRPCTAKNR